MVTSSPLDWLITRTRDELTSRDFVTTKSFNSRDSIDITLVPPSPIGVEMM